MRTLIVYGTKHGTVEKCVGILSKQLSGQVDMHNLKTERVPDISRYDNVIIGGSIYMGQVQKEVRAFCEENLTILKGKRMGFFICCMFKDQAEQLMTNAYPKELLQTALSSDCFGGEMDVDKMGFGERLIIKMVSKTLARNDDKLASAGDGKGTKMLDEDRIASFAVKMNQAG